MPMEGIAMSSEQALEPLIAAAVNGSHPAFGVLYRQLSPAVLSYLRAQGAREPEDLCSEVFLGVFRNISGFSGGGPQFRSWVFSVAHHRVVDERRRVARRPEQVALDDMSREQAPLLRGSRKDAGSDAEERMGTERVLEICASLVPDQRDVLLLRLVCDLSVDQVAALLGKSSGAVKALQRRALASVNRNVSNEGVPL